MATYKGFNTVGRNFPPFGLTDVELVKRDLLNHFNTRFGERVMNPEFGTVIFDLLMDPQDPQTRNLILEDALRIIAAEPRVRLASLDVQEFEHQIILAIDLVFIAARVQDSLFVTYKLNIEQDTF